MSFTNWSGGVQADPERFERPRSEPELAAAIRRAAQDGSSVRVVGAGHSFTPLVATRGTLLQLDEMNTVFEVDRARQRATISAGVSIRRLAERLHEAGFGLRNQGDIDVQSLAGAVGTGTHGTGLGLGSFSTQVVGLEMMGASGEPMTIDERSDWLPAARLSLGALGVVTHLTLQVVPAYRLHERIWKRDASEGLDELDDWIASHRHFEFFWWPSRDRFHFKALAATEADPDPLPGKKGERIDWSHRVFPSDRDERFEEMEYSVDLDRGNACFLELRDCVLRQHPDLVWPIEYRTVAADDVWLSPSHGRRVAAISVHQGASLEHVALFRDCEAIFRAFDGRPHWGKRHSLRASTLGRLVPRFSDFAQVRQRLDPEGVFLNDHLRDLFLEKVG